eukprot:scaffold65962_cov25-Tisochrysis_lutea.AAC.6
MGIGEELEGEGDGMSMVVGYVRARVRIPGVTDPCFRAARGRDAGARSLARKIATVLQCPSTNACMWRREEKASYTKVCYTTRGAQ